MAVQEADHGVVGLAVLPREPPCDAADLVPEVRERAGIENHTAVGALDRTEAFVERADGRQREERREIDEEALRGSDRVPWVIAPKGPEHDLRRPWGAGDVGTGEPGDVVPHEDAGRG